MLRKIIIITFNLLLVTAVYAQKYTISGYITDIEDGEKLIGANVYDANNYKGTTTNSYGFYSITLNKGKVLLTVSYVGYSPFQKEIDLNKDITLNIEMTPNIELEEVVVEGKLQEGGVESSQMSVINIPMKTIRNLPILLGEPDIIKMVQLLPGVQSGSEGMSGMYVRGGGPDQNLILLDGVPVYNASHLFGFFSVFNSNAIQNVKLIKGGFPARYGGRLSSVLDISMKEGNTKEFHGRGGIGLIASNLTLEGPIGKKASFIVSGRRTYLDLLAYPFFLMQEKQYDYDELRYGYFFHDLNAKINYKFSDKSRLYLSTYLGKDKFYGKEADSYTESVWNPDTGEMKEVTSSYRDDLTFWWGNITSALRWNYMINKKFFANTTLTYSRYKILTGMDSKWGKSHETMEYTSGITDWSGKVDFDYYPSPNHSVKFGVIETYHSFNPGVYVEKYNASDTSHSEKKLGDNPVYAHEFSAYAEDDFRIGALIKMNLGLRWTGFSVGNTFYNSFEPRASMRFLATERLSFKAAFAQMNQYLNLLANSNVGLPFDLWVPATEKIKPQKAYQVALGSVYALNKDINISVEGFYKKMDNLVEYKEGASFFELDKNWQTKIAQGKGWSYGIELLVMKKYGKTTGWIGYTWSKSNRQFDRPGQEISFGNIFPYKYDRRHDISIVISHKLNDHIDMGLTWVFGTGNATTLGYEKYPSYFQTKYGQTPNSSGYSDNEPDITYYGSRNNFRMPSYHRLDLGINFHKEKKWGKRTWSVSIYNVYNRKNPFMLKWERDLKTNKYKLMQISLFPIIPSVAYRFEF